MQSLDDVATNTLIVLFLVFCVWFVASCFVAGGIGTYLEDSSIGCIVFGGCLLAYALLAIPAFVISQLFGPDS